MNNKYLQLVTKPWYSFSRLYTRLHSVALSTFMIKCLGSATSSI